MSISTSVDEHWPCAYMCLKNVSKIMYDVTTRPGLVQRDFTVSKCVAKSVSLFLSVCLCVCKSVGLFLTCVLECVKECLYVYEC